MKSFLIILCILCILLCGCHADYDHAEVRIESANFADTILTVNQGYYKSSAQEEAKLFPEVYHFEEGEVVKISFSCRACGTYVEEEHRVPDTVLLYCECCTDQYAEECQEAICIKLKSK